MERVVKQTFRGTAETLSGPSFWLIVCGVTMICFISGPFGTLEILPLGFRLVYWTLMVLPTAALGVWLHTLVRVNEWRNFFSICVVGLVFGVVASAIIIILGFALLSPIQKYPGALDLFFYSFPSATLIFISTVFLDNWRHEYPKNEEKLRPILLSRLKKYPNAQHILSLVAQDHYVEITTELGSELCLIRLSDAISEVAPIDGIQIHRSIWVAKSAIKKVNANSFKAEVMLMNGNVLKVSQSRVNELKSIYRNPIQQA